MKSAKEMFEELGYEIEQNNEKWLVYINAIAYDEFGGGRIDKVIFDKQYKEISSTTDDMFVPIPLCELQAINKQVEELGWK